LGTALYKRQDNSRKRKSKRKQEEPPEFLIYDEGLEDILLEKSKNRINDKNRRNI